MGSRLQRAADQELRKGADSQVLYRPAVQPGTAQIREGISPLFSFFLFLSSVAGRLGCSSRLEFDA